MRPSETKKELSIRKIQNTSIRRDVIPLLGAPERFSIFIGYLYPVANEFSEGQIWQGGRRMLRILARESENSSYPNTNNPRVTWDLGPMHWETTSWEVYWTQKFLKNVWVLLFFSPELGTGMPQQDGQIMRCPAPPPELVVHQMIFWPPIRVHFCTSGNTDT